VSYAAAKISRLTAFGDVAAANKKLSFELLTLRRAVERDRYGVMAQVMVTRDQCTPSQCAVFRALSDSRQIMANMTERTYDGLIARYAPAWNAPAAAGPVAALGSSIPTGARDVRERTGNRDQYAGGCERGFAFTAPDIECCPRSAGDRQKAGAEATFGRRAGSACAGSAGLGDRQRMTLSKAVADR
jgi:hypothetical protein